MRLFCSEAGWPAPWLRLTDTHSLGPRSHGLISTVLTGVRGQRKGVCRLREWKCWQGERAPALRASVGASVSGLSSPENGSAGPGTCPASFVRSIPTYLPTYTAEGPDGLATRGEKTCHPSIHASLSSSGGCISWAKRGQKTGGYNRQRTRSGPVQSSPVQR
ncbi:hypothetical protein LX32DRAFT_71825 [Colletotrichum zoysiae]|uniref:Uncharacterized protein n=1 Tax=Colletotrichum zoysiae TaxID=1216348 RepID=A0AAD9LXT3_9PEZI|nr:hypothetical protein LX32DRAFT_71825 [Colletotrichum zoysiae]